jgi:hypothetical protein
MEIGDKYKFVGEDGTFTIVKVTGESRRYPQGKIILKDAYGDKIVYPNDFSDPIEFGDYFEKINEGGENSEKYLLNDDEELDEGIEFEGDPENSGDLQKAERMSDDKETDVTIQDPNDEDERITVTHDMDENKIFTVGGFRKLLEGKEEINLTEEEIFRIIVEEQNPIMSKSELVETIGSQLNENRMNNDIRRKLQDGSTDYSEHLDAETIQRLADETFEEIKTNAEQKGGNNLHRAQEMMLMSLQNVMGIEEQHRPELERLAIQLTMEEHGISEGQIEFEAHLVPLGQVRKGDIRYGEEDIDLGESVQPRITPTVTENTPTVTENRPTITEDDEPQSDGEPRRRRTAEELKPELTKRRLINAMMHGAARKGQYLYHMSDRIREIDPNLTNEYSNIMMGNDLTYWGMSDGDISMMAQMNDQHAGNVKVEYVGRDIPKVIAQGITFPMLLHELSKGVMEVLGMWGMGDLDATEQKYVMGKVDHLENETWDIRLGPKIWEKITMVIPNEAIQHKSIILSELFQLPAEEFNSTVAGILNGNQESIDYVVNLAQEIDDDIRREDSEEALSQFSNDYSDEEDDGYAPQDGESQVDDVLAGLTSNDTEEEEGEFDPSTLSQRELQDMVDQALDDGDFDTVKYLSGFMK